MVRQAYDWTCSVCSITWTLQATKRYFIGTNVYDARTEVGTKMGYPYCINETYGCMSGDCVVDVYDSYGIEAIERWVTFDEAYSICSRYTGVINPKGMYHFMAIRGTIGPDIWVANSGPGYKGVWDNLSRAQFESFGPVKVIYLESYK